MNIYLFTHIFIHLCFIYSYISIFILAYKFMHIDPLFYILDACTYRYILGCTCINIFQYKWHFIQEETTASVILRFVRPVSNDQIVKAFDESLGGIDKQVLTDFRCALSKATSNGLKKGDELCFHFPKHGGIVVSSGNYISSGIESEELAKRLLEVYIDDHRTVSKDLLQCIKDNIDLIETE